MKIARSQVLGICACCNYHELVDICEKMASVHFELLSMAHLVVLQIVHFTFSIPVVYQPHPLCVLT